MSRKAEQSEATRSALLAAGLELFGERSYAEVGTEEIVRRAGVTRGALYHHFADKADLFAAVYEELEGRVTQELGSVAASAPDPRAALSAGALAFLDAALDPAVQRIILIEGPTVLGYERWREIAERHGLGLIRAALQAAMDAGQITEQPVIPLSHIVLATLDEAAIYVARAEDRKAARGEMGVIVERMVASLEMA